MSSESDCKDGIFKAKTIGDGGYFYSYLVLKRLCMMVAYVVQPDNIHYKWEYRGGCYTDGDIIVYEKAVAGTDYKFD